MKIFLFPISFFFFLFTAGALFGQQKEQAVRFANGNFITGNNIQKKAFKKEDIRAALYHTHYFVVLQFNILPDKMAKENLKNSGIFLENYLPGNAYLASIKSDFNFETIQQSAIISVNVLPTVYKINKSLLNYSPAVEKDGGVIAVGYFKSVPEEIIQKELQNAGAVIVKTKFTQAGIIFIKTDKNIFNAIAVLPFVTSLSLQIIKDTPINYFSRAATGVSGLNAVNGKNLNGKGVAVGIGDNADMSTNIDLSGRLIVRTSTSPASHGTHVAGTVGGAGIINTRHRGMASKATLINQYFSDIISAAPTYITDYNMVLTNNSYYSALQDCAGEGQYDFLSNYADEQLNQYKQLLHVVAAGNDGALTCNSFPASFATIKSGWQCAKNVLTVGAANVQNYSISYFSSRGPVTDGRLKPEITANGWAVISTGVNNSYFTNFGTSMATPGVTGALSLLHERYKQLNNGNNPSAALMKTLVCNTAEDLGNAGPDYTFGFGMLNATRAVDALENNRYFSNSVSNGASNTKTIIVPANTRRLKIMLYWADPAATINAATTLVNDLDLTVTTPSAIVHQPFILNPNTLHVNDVAVEGADHTNNIEQAIIENPAAGNYTINIAGFAVPFGPQPYVVSYELLPLSVNVLYPSGGETLVPGERENIRWNAYGNETNTFTIESSMDNGNSWGLINNNVPAGSMTYQWTVPATVSNTALIRVTRNGTLLSDQSKFAFTILGQPAVSAANACPGSVQLNWAAIPGATAYDILQLDADSMKVIGNTTANTYLVQGLNKNNTTWFGVAAKNGSSSGRRSLSVTSLPNSGACTLVAFNNDLLVDSILTPATARQHFKNENNATAPVNILIRNSGSIPTAGPFNVSYTNGTITVTETINNVIEAGGTLSYSFTGIYPIIAAGFKYNFKAWVTFAADGNHLNDTAYKIVKSINNDPITAMPIVEGFETMAALDFLNRELATGGNNFLDFNSSTNRGRARTFVNTGFAHTGNRSLTLDQRPQATTTTADSATLNYNLINFSADQLRMDFYYLNHGQANNPGNKIWIRGSENSAWIMAYDLFLNQALPGQWKHGLLNVNDVLLNAVPVQNITATFQIKFGEEGNTSANNVNQRGGGDNGYTYDDIVIKKALNDIALLKINSPDKTGCGLSSTSSVSITIKNFNNAVLNNVPVSYQVNGGPIVTETIATINPNQLLNYTFSQTANLAAFTDYSINCWVKYAFDSYPENDSILKYTFHNTPVIASYPYLQSFELDNGNFYTNGTNNSWQWGIPAKTIINKSAGGSKAWVTNLKGNYNDNETSYLYTPCFDISSLTHPTLSFSHIFNIEQDFDYTWVEYSTDGVTWQKLGSAGAGTNWYDGAAINVWRLSNNKWHVANFDIPSGIGNVRFRFVLSSDSGLNMEGVGVDDVTVHEASLVAVNPPVINVSAASVKGNNWVPFNMGNQAAGPWYVLAEINPNGQDLGKVDINLYPNTTGLVRTDNNNHYYLDRSFVIHPDNPPTANVGVRLYFTDAEAKALIAATGCANCIKPATAYELGISKYSGPLVEENGLLDDDLSGYFQYILPANTSIIPHGNGYYAEFSVNSFSEFWFNNGGINNMLPLPIELISFDASKQIDKALLSWKTEREVGTAKFIIERSGDTRTFKTIGTVQSQSTITVNQYTFIDAQPIAGINYYRLKIVKRNGSFTYSPLRKLDFGSNADAVLIYPNPVNNGKVFISSSADCTSASLYDASGKLMQNFNLQGRNNTLDIKKIAKGIYQLKVITANGFTMIKLLIE